MNASPTHYVCAKCDCHMREYRIHYYVPPVPLEDGEERFAYDERDMAYHNFLCAKCAPSLGELVKS